MISIGVPKCYHSACGNGRGDEFLLSRLSGMEAIVEDLILEPVIEHKLLTNLHRVSDPINKVN